MTYFNFGAYNIVMRIHFIGSHGASIKRLMQISEFLGYSVTGSDARSKEGHRAENVEGADLVVYSAAVKRVNVELIAAKALGIRMLERSEFLGELSAEFKSVIAVSGTHGKTSASSMIAEIFSGRDTCVHIGGECGHIQQDGKEFFVTEACEYKQSFLTLKPELAVILNMDLDHTDCYSNIGEYRASFKQFAAKAKKVLINGDDPYCFEWAALVGYLTFGLDVKNDYYASNITYSKQGVAFDFCYRGDILGKVQVDAVGEHSVLNALSAAASAHIAGLSLEEIISGLRQYRGVRRRFEFLDAKSCADVYSDYAHHPTEIRASISAARSIGYKKIIVAFEPHTFTRTQSLYKDFARSLLLADEIYVMPIYAAREVEIDGVKSNMIVDVAKKFRDKIDLVLGVNPFEDGLLAGEKGVKKLASVFEYMCGYDCLFRVLDGRLIECCIEGDKCDVDSGMFGSEVLGDVASSVDNSEKEVAVIFMGAGTVDDKGREYVGIAK